MTKLPTTSHLVTLITAALVAMSGSLIAAPSASAAKADLVWYLDQTFREVIDIQGDGTDVGDITVANGNISETRGGKAVGTYALVAVEANVAIPGGRTTSSSDMALTVGKDTIYTVGIKAANAGLPPEDRFVRAIIGGTGKYSGARGQVVVRPISATEFKYSFFFVD